MPYCQECGAEVWETASFCSECGAAVDESEVAAAGTDTAGAGETGGDEPAWAQDEAFSTGDANAHPVVEEVPSLRTDLQCRRAAEYILRQADGPLWSATVTIPTDVGFALTEAIDPSQIPTPPDGQGLRVESVDTQAGEIRLELGVGRSLSKIVKSIENKVSETARQA